MAISFEVQDIPSFTHPTPFLLPTARLQSLPLSPVTPELKRMLQYSPFPADYALIGCDKSFCVAFIGINTSSDIIPW